MELSIETRLRELRAREDMEPRTLIRRFGLWRHVVLHVICLHKITSNRIQQGEKDVR